MSTPSSETDTPDISIVVPVYNNASTLEELIDRLTKVLEGMGRTYEMIFVDDGSRDSSFALLQARARNDVRIRPFAMVRNFGSQAAVCAAFDQVRGRYVVALDADLENCPEDVPALVAKLDEGCDLVCGYREIRDASFFKRRLPSALMNAYVRKQTGTRIRDLGCGMRGLQAWMVHDLASDGEHRRLLTPLLLRRARSVTEVPLSQGVIRQSSGHSFLTLLGIAADYYMLTAKRPFLVSAIASLTAVAAGMVTMTAGATMPGLVIGVGGLLGALVSLVGEYCQRLYVISQRLPFYQLRRPDHDAERSDSGPAGS